MRSFVTLCVLLTSATLWAATGTISASSTHFGILDGNTRGATISWSTTASKGEVYVSIDQGPEVFVARNKQAKKLYEGIAAPHTYVFTLYEGTAHTTPLDTCTISTHYGNTSVFGLNYTFKNMTNIFLTDANWSANKRQVEADLNLMASMGCGVLRLFFWPNWEDIGLTSEGIVFNPGFYEEKRNAGEFLKMCADRRIQVIVCFGNSYLAHGPDSTTKWWQVGYGSDWQGFKEDSARWIRETIETIEASEGRSAVLYYDFESEGASEIPGFWDYAVHVVENGSIPKGRFGFSPLRPESDTALLGTYFYNRPLDFLDIHVYPAINYNDNFESMVAYVKSLQPKATVLIGEFGIPTPTTAGEADQQANYLQIWNRIKAAGIPYGLVWQLYDDSPLAGASYGLIHGNGDPKSALGGFASLFSLVPNSDLENGSGGVATGSYQSTGPSGRALTRVVNAELAATNSSFLRLTTPAAPGLKASIQTRKVKVAGGKPIYVNAYVRTNAATYRCIVLQYDEAGTLIGQSNSPIIAGSGAWQSFQETVAGWSPTLLPGTTTVKLAFKVLEVGSGVTLDVDTVSVRQAFGVRP